MAQLFRAVGLLGCAACASALRLENPKATAVDLMNTRGVEASCEPPAAYRQELTNMMDLQYFTEISLGGQKITGILDTGSFELVVFSKGCASCGMAGVYDSTTSTTFQASNLSKIHSYGSGSCESQGGSDEVTLGCYKTPHQAMWLAVNCQMPLLAQAGFQSIVGVGPPGQPEFTAKETLKELDMLEAKMKETKQEVPQEVKQARRAAEAELKDAAGKKSLLESFNMSTFSTCLGRKKGSSAWMIWNDETRESKLGVMKIPVVGNITWGIALSGFSLEFNPSSDLEPKSSVSEENVGCADGCGAVVDTGTSLIGVPTTTYRSVAMLMEQRVNATDCADLSKFPTLIISVAGHKLRLPPSSYLGTVEGMPSEQVAQYMPQLMRQVPTNPNACQLLLMDMGMQMTTLGPMAILGMPLFREYYTTFNLGAGRGHRSIFVSPADESCNPELDGRASFGRSSEGTREAFKPRHVDLSKVRVPHWLERRSGKAI